MQSIVTLGAGPPAQVTSCPHVQVFSLVGGFPDAFLSTFLSGPSVVHSPGCLPMC